MMYDLSYSYKQGENGVDHFYKLLKEIGLEPPMDSPLEKAFLDSWSIVEKFDKGESASIDGDAYEKYSNFCALNDYVGWIERAGGAKKLDECGLISHVKLLRDALVSPAFEANDDHSRKMLELIIALNLLRFVDEIDVDDCEHSNSDTQIPDICFRLGEKWYAIECKTPSTQDKEGLWGNIQKASLQINAYEKHPIEFGIPILSPRNAMLTKGLYNQIPYAHYQLPLGEFSGRLNNMLKPLREKQFIDALNEDKHKKTTKGFGIFENVITKVHWGLDQFAVTNLKVCDFYPLGDSNPYADMTYKVIRELNHQIQHQNTFLYDWKTP